jgi:hypothetical protein
MKDPSFPKNGTRNFMNDLTAAGDSPTDET